MRSTPVKDKQITYIQYGQVDLQRHIECLLTIGSHFQVPVNHLATIDSQIVSEKESGLVPMGRWRGGPGLKSHILLAALEDRIKVQGIAMDDASCLYSMLEEEVYFLQILKRAATFKVED